MTADLSLTGPVMNAPLSHSFQPSPMQLDFFNFVKANKASCVLEAVAGSGKSTTIVQSLVYVPEHEAVLILAFNAAIVKEMKVKLDELRASTGRAFKNVWVRTFHSLGYGAVCKRLGLRPDQIETSGTKCRDLARELWTPETYEAYSEFCADLVSLAKGDGIGPLVHDTDGAWRDLIDHHDLFLDSQDATLERAVELARELLARSNQVVQERRLIDYDDMLYLPLFWGLSLFRQHRIYVDEGQDTNPVRRALAKLALRPGGKLYAAGDRGQAIYGFCHPPGTTVLTPYGEIEVEKLEVGSPVIVAATGGETAGWQVQVAVQEVHRYEHSGLLLCISAGERSVQMTPHHRVPVRVDEAAAYYTYLMRRDGIYRVGYCQDYTGEGDFMLTHRLHTERADAAWLLGSYRDRADAVEAEKVLLRRVKGVTFYDKTSQEVVTMRSDEVEALKLLAEHGRMVDFPLLTSEGRNHRIARNGAFVTEACNVMDGMRVAFFDESQNSEGRGRGRQSFAWTPCEVTARHYSGPVYGITVPVLEKRIGWPLYFAGHGHILVHNTGASHDALDLIRKEFNAVELPLTVSYRCPRAAEAEVKHLVPHFSVHASAPKGEVLRLTVAQALPKLDANAVILCRNTAPLVSLAYALMSNRIPCHVLGSEIGKGLVALVTKMKARTVDGLLEKLAAYREREVAKHMAKGKEQKAAAVSDRVACVETFAEALDETERTVSKLIRAIEDMFKDGGKVLTLSTLHKAKGREWNTVAIYRQDLLPSPFARQEWQHRQEMNLDYVGKTRFKRTMIYLTDTGLPARVGKAKAKKSEEQKAAA